MFGGVVEAALASAASPSPRNVRPRPACRLMSQVKKLRARLNVTCASSAWSKYLPAIASRLVGDARAQRVGQVDLLAGDRDLHSTDPSPARSGVRERRPAASGRHGLLPFALHRAGMRSASRYLATVRRAMSTPSRRRNATIASSDRTSAGSLGADQGTDAVAHRFRAVALAIGAVRSRW